MRQLMSVVDKGSRSSYTIIEEPDILSIPDVAHSWYGGRPVGTISGAETIETPARPTFDAMDFTIESSLEPLFESTGTHVDIKVWSAAKYESRVRGLYITENDASAEKHFGHIDYDRVPTVHGNHCWFVLSCSQDIKTIEQTWTGSQEIKDVQDISPQRIMISLYVQYRKDDDGAPIRELTYLALTESAAKKMLVWRMLERDELVVSAEELGLKLREARASSNENYFQRYAYGQTSVLYVTASDFDKLSDRVVLTFRNDPETTSYAGRLDSFIKSTCDNLRVALYKSCTPCLRCTKTVHSLTVEPHCVQDPTQACVFINTEVMSSGICAYVVNPTSEEINDTWITRQLLRMVTLLKNCWDHPYMYFEKPMPVRPISEYDSKILLWIVSDPHWDLYTAIKYTLMMPGLTRFISELSDVRSIKRCRRYYSSRMDRIHEYLACFRQALIRHKCGTGTPGGTDGGTPGYANRVIPTLKTLQKDIQKACKECCVKEKRL
jgi:hypothetical protein